MMLARITKFDKTFNLFYVKYVLFRTINTFPAIYFVAKASLNIGATKQTEKSYAIM